MFLSLKLNGRRKSKKRSRLNTNQTPNITVIASGRRKEREKAMRTWHYKHKQKNFKPKVETECLLIESVLLEILKLIKEEEGKSRAVIIERMIIYLLEKDRGNTNETAWDKSKRSYRRTLKNYEKETKAKRKHLQKAKKDAEKKKLYICKNSPFSYFRGY
uniref:Phage protein n=1 Tax=Helicobacter pylori TaxID=210 RepID=A0A060CUK1_HELPX|nr:phage protein [Helicobacter pylori]